MSENKIYPNRDDIKIFMHVVFSGLDGYVSLRSFTEKGGTESRPPTHEWIEADTSDIDGNYIDKVDDFAKKAALVDAGCYVISGTVAERGRAKAADVIQMQTLLIDIDEGDTEEKLRTLTEAIGEPTLIVESGGITKEGCMKLHIYWQLLGSVSGDDLTKLGRITSDVFLVTWRVEFPL